MVPIGPAGVPPAEEENPVVAYMITANCSPVVLSSTTQAFAELLLLLAVDRLYCVRRRHRVVLYTKMWNPALLALSLTLLA